MGPRISAPGRRRSRQRRLLVPPGAKTGSNRVARGRGAGDRLGTAWGIGMSVKNANLVKGSTGDWDVVIGLEIHAHVTSNSKLFSGASTEFGGEPNSHVSLVDAAMPGMLPVINEFCVAQAVRTGLGLNAQINLRSVFERKNYFYPDLPQGYQISQYKSPLVGEGEGVVDFSDGNTVTAGIKRLHLEHDAGKSLHARHSSMPLPALTRAALPPIHTHSNPDIPSSA